MANNKVILSIPVDTATDNGKYVKFNSTSGAMEMATSSSADTALSNLASVAINTTLVSDTDNTDALGTAAISWSDLFLGSGSVITWSTAPSTADITLTHSENTLTLAGGDLALSNLTASEIIITDANKKLVSAAVATYPSLTELSYVKGVTSAIQTQIGNQVPKSLYDAHTVLYATTDNTPAALTVTEQTVVGRATGGNITAIAIDSDLSSVSANDDTIPSAKATKTALDAKALDSEVVKYNTLKRNGDVFVAQGDENDGTVSGGVTISSGAMVFDGVDGKATTTFLPTDIDTTDYTFSVWVNHATIHTSNVSAEMKPIWGMAYGDDYIYLNLRNSQYQFRHAKLGGTDRSITQSQIASQWVNLVGIVDNTNSQIILRIDDNNQTSGAITPTGFTLTNALTIGFHTGSSYFEGSINNLQIWNRKLTDEEITTIYSAGKDAPSPIQDGLVAQYSGRDFEGTEATPTSILDTAVSIVRKPIARYKALTAGTLALDFLTRSIITVTPNATATFTTTIPEAGRRCTLIILTSGTDSYTMTFGTGFKTTGTLATGTTTAKKFVVNFISDGTELIETSRTTAM